MSSFKLTSIAAISTASLIFLISCDKDKSNKETRDSNIDNVSLNLKKFLPGFNEDGSEDREGLSGSNKVLIGECDNKDTAIITMHSNRDFHIAVGKHSEDGKYRADRDSLKFYKNEMDDKPFFDEDIMTCSYMEGNIIISDVTIERYLRCTFKDLNFFSTVSQCSSINVITKQTKEAKRQEKEAKNPVEPQPREPVVVIEGPGKKESTIPEGYEKSALSGTWSGTCGENDLVQAQLTLQTTGKFTFSLEDRMSPVSENGIFYKEKDGHGLTMFEDTFNDGMIGEHDNMMMQCTPKEGSENFDCTISDSHLTTRCTSVELTKKL